MTNFRQLLSNARHLKPRPESTIFNWFQQRGLPLLSLVALYFASVPEGISRQAMLLVHVGLFLIWQPLISPQHRLGEKSLVWLVLLTTLVVSGYPLLILIWAVTLTALVAGQVFAARMRRTRLFHLGLVLALLWLIMVRLAPITFGLPLTAPSLLTIGLIILALLVPVLPEPRRENVSLSLDFWLSLVVFLMVILLLLGALAVSLKTGWGYLPASACMALTIAAGVLLLAYLWEPRAGFTGVRLWLSNYLLNLSTPFERWTGLLAKLAAEPLTPAEFLHIAAPEALILPWLNGGHWRYQQHLGQFGNDEGQSHHFEHKALRLELKTDRKLTPALSLHCQLLTQVLSEFVEAKARETQLEQQAYVQAVHETGAKLTHDIKNVLQTLHSLITAARETRADEAADLLQMFGRHLPVLADRLESLVTQLKTPEVTHLPRQLPATQWWRLVQQRSPLLGVHFHPARVREGDLIPVDIFDSAFDNLLSNARQKQPHGTALTIDIRLFWENGIVLSVTDNGEAIPPALAGQLFTQPLPSSQGLGVGLYQVRLQCERQNAQISLHANHPGQVEFRLMYPLS